MNLFAADWLAQREPADAIARDAGLARRFAAALPVPARLADLGAGTGANARALAPIIGGDQDWLLVEPDPALRAGQGERLRAWPQRWRFTGLALDLAGDWRPLEAAGLAGVTCSAFLDLASAAWIERLADWLAPRRLPFLAALTVDGRRLWTPSAPEDETVAAAFRSHQARDKGLGPALGAAAAETAARLLAGRGFQVVTVASDWRLDSDARTLLVALVAGEADAALAEAPGAAPAIARWRARRLAEAEAGRLGAVIGHRDLLALPG